jgi:hypothetical protein
MTALQRLARTELISLGSLVVVAALVAALLAFLSSIHPSAFVSREPAQVGFFGTLLLGVIPVGALCAPTYAWLSHRGWATWPAVLLLGAFPGFVWLVVNLQVGLFTLACGLSVALLTHIAFVRLPEP